MKQQHILVGFLFCLFWSCEKPKPPKEDFRPSIYVKKVESRTIPIQVDAIGHFTAYNSAEIKPQVEGRLLEMHFEEGSEVEEGQLLFTIDPRPYEAKRDQAIARRAQDYAAFQFSAERVARYQALLPESYVSELDYIQYQTDLANFEAAILRDDADIRMANIDLEYCYIRAPFSGITGKKLVDIGNLVTNNGNTLILLNQIDPIFIDFSIPERDFFRLIRYQRQSDLNVEFAFPEYPNQTFLAKLVVIGNEINQMTGMIPLRAELCNIERLFWPGQFLRCKVIFKYEEGAMMVPESAINIGQKGQYIYVVKKNNRAEYRAIEIGESFNDEVQLLKGVTPGEKVITEGQINVSPNSTVIIKERDDEDNAQ